MENQQHGATAEEVTPEISRHLKDTPGRSCTLKTVKDRFVASRRQIIPREVAGFTQAFVDDLELSE